MQCVEPHRREGRKASQQPNRDREPQIVGHADPLQKQGRDEPEGQGAAEIDHEDAERQSVGLAHPSIEHVAQDRACCAAERDGGDCGDGHRVAIC